METSAPNIDKVEIKNVEIKELFSTGTLKNLNLDFVQTKANKER